MDKKSQHVGNHGGRYTDIDGNTKQFTVIDHDKKTKILKSENEKIPVTFFSLYRDELIDRVLALPASLCPFEFVDFTIRGADKANIEWNKTMIKDNGLEIRVLRDLCCIIENRYYGNKIIL